MASYAIRAGNFPAEVLCNGATVLSYGPSLVYYADSQDVTPTLYEGTLAAGESASLEGAQFFTVASGKASLSVGSPQVTTTSAVSDVVQSFSSPGTLSPAVGAAKLRLPFDMQLVSVVATVGSAPSGTTIGVDVNRNGTTVFTNQAGKPVIPIGTTVSNVAIPDVTLLGAGDFVTVDVDTVGSGSTGSNLTVTLYLQRSFTSPPPPAPPAPPPDPIARWLASDLALANNDPVSSWADKTGNGHTLTQATGGSQPHYVANGGANSKPAVDFDGVADFMATAAFASPTSGAILAVCRSDGSPAYSTTQQLFTHAAADTWASPFARYAMRIYGPLAVWSGWVEDAVGGNTVYDVELASASSWHVRALTYDGAAIGLWRNLTQVAGAGHSGALASSTKPVLLGARTGPADFFGGMIAEVRYYGQSLNSTDFNTIMTELIATYTL